jgi:hypothetical protein
VGLICFTANDEKFNGDTIAQWFEDVLAPCLGPYPGPRSLVVCDNMPQHRQYQIESRIHNAVVARGAALIWGPAQSPDLNVRSTCHRCLLLVQSRRVAFACCCPSSVACSAAGCV